MHKTIRKLGRVLFSLLLMMSFIQPNLVVKALGVDQTASIDIVRTVALSYKLKGSSSFVDLIAPYQIADITKVDLLHAQYQFELIDHVDPITGAPNRSIHEGDYYLIDLPSQVQIIAPVNGTILGNGGRPLANFSFSQNPDLSWQIKIEYTAYVDDQNEYDIHGMMAFDFILDLSAVAEGTTTTISIPIDNGNSIDIDVTKPIPAPTTPISLTKTITSYTPLTREIVWNVKMMPDIGKFSGCTFTDTLNVSLLDLKSIKHGNVTLVLGTDYTFDSATGLITYLIPVGRDGLAYQNVIITAVVKRSVYGTLTPTSISNQAQLTGGVSFVDLVSNTSTQTITPNWFVKTGTVVQGNKIQWSYDINTNTQSMFNGVITDVFNNLLTLDITSVKLGATSVPVYLVSHVPLNDAEVYGVLVDNGDGTSTLNVFLPRTKALASSSKQTLTLITTVDTPDTVTTLDPIYTNTAKFNGDLVLDNNAEMNLPESSSGPIPVGVPNVNINKGHSTWSAAEKRNGEITWTIAVSSNLTSYGTSSIIDTLPADQDFIADQIFYGALSLTSLTNPSAVISSDGRTLTITFSNNNAWATQQNLTVKTKIKQDSYGLNVNRDFTNTAKAIIYSESTGLELDSMIDSDTIRIQNTVISKSSGVYNGNTTKQGENPRVNFSIVLNNNLMPLQSVLISDNLANIITEFKKSTESSFSVISGLNWTYVANSMTITKNSGTLDALNLTTIASTAQVVANILTVDFGSGVAVNDKYTLTFTLEVDANSNEIFQQNGVMRVRGNISGVEAVGLKAGTIVSSATPNSSEIKNEVLVKTGVHNVAEQQAVWSINLNQHRVGLLNTRVVDQLPLGLTLDPTSIKLYENVIGTNGNFLTGNAVVTQGTAVPFTYTYLPTLGVGNEGRFTLTVDLPNNTTSYVLRFATDISPALLGTQVTNSAYFVGNDNLAENTNNSSLTFSSAVGGGSTTKASVTVNKTSKDNGALVDGALFELNWLRGGNPTDPVFVRTLGTINGSVIFRGLTRGEIYTITEVSAPSGYLLDSTVPVEVVPPATGVTDAPPVTLADTPIKYGNWDPTALKHLDGIAFTETFHFEIMKGIIPVMRGVTSSVNPNGDFNVIFSMMDEVNSLGVSTYQDDFTFDALDPAGTRHLVSSQRFIMREVDDYLPGYTIDRKEVGLTLSVYNEKGKSDLVLILKDDLGNILSDESANFLTESKPIFYNVYDATGSFSFVAQKILLNHQLTLNQFSFELYEGNTLLQTAKNGAGSWVDGTHASAMIYFTALNYTISDVGVKTYRIVEKQTMPIGYIGDPAVYTIEVQISDNSNGTVKSSIISILKDVDGLSSSESSIVFSNTYDPSLVPPLPNTGEKETNDYLGFILATMGGLLYLLSRKPKDRSSNHAK